MEAILANFPSTGSALSVALSSTAGSTRVFLSAAPTFFVFFSPISFLLSAVDALASSPPTASSLCPPSKSSPPRISENFFPLPRACTSGEAWV